MKAKKYKIGKSSVAVGNSYYTASYHEADGECDTKEHVTINEHVLRSVRRKYWKANKHDTTKHDMGQYAHFTLKSKYVTWVKLSKKHFDWGFDKYIPDWFKHSFPVDPTITYYDFSPTAAGALRKELARIRAINVSASKWYTKEYKTQAVKKLTQKLNRELKKSWSK